MFILDKSLAEEFSVTLVEGKMGKRHNCFTFSNSTIEFDYFNL